MIELSVLYNSHPIVTIVLMGSINVETVTHIMLKHICCSDLKPFRRYMCFILAPLLALNICITSSPIVNEVQLLYFSSGVALSITSVTLMRVRQKFFIYFYFDFVSPQDMLGGI